MVYSRMNKFHPDTVEKEQAGQDSISNDMWF